MRAYASTTVALLLLLSLIASGFGFVRSNFSTLYSYANTPNKVEYSPQVALLPEQDPSLFSDKLADLREQERLAELKRKKERQAKIDKVEAFFQEYGAKISGHGHILVDQAEACGGNYKILVGIAGAESGLGRHMYKKYNPFGYLNGVQYPNLKTALSKLSCKISEQHIAPCGNDLYCLANRYTGPGDDNTHFVNKVRWFMQQIG